MKTKIEDFFYKYGNLIVPTFFVLIFLLLNLDHISLYLLSKTTVGFDGVSHFAIGKIYSENIFPGFFGWIHNWYLGMPFPQFYPPIFYFIVAILAGIFPISYEEVFRLFVVFILLSQVFFVVWLIFRNFFKNLHVSFLAGIISVLVFSVEDNRFIAWGEGTRSVLYYGLVTQGLAFIFILFFIHFIQRIKENHFYFILTVIMVSLVILTNSQMVPVIIILLVSFFLADIMVNIESFKKNLKLYIFIPILSLVLGSFWYIPMIVNYRYVNSISIYSKLGIDFNFVIVGIIFSIITFLFYFKKKTKGILLPLAISIAFIISLLSVYIIDYFNFGGPIQPFRWVSVLTIMVIIIDPAFIFYSIFEEFKNKTKIYIVTFLSIILISLFFPWILDKTEIDIYRKETYQDIKNVASLFSQKDKVIQVEKFNLQYGFVTAAINSYLPIYGGSTNFVVFRESAISSVFTIPLINSLSSTKESWGFRSYLVDDEIFSNYDEKLTLPRAQFLGIDFFLVRSKNIKDKLKINNEVYYKDGASGWELYGFNNPVNKTNILQYEPVLLFAPVVFKDRPIDGYDYARFQEELLFNNSFNTILASPTNDFIDISSDLERFKVAIISEYKYKNLKDAIKRLSDFSKENKLIFIADNDPLFFEMSGLRKNKNIIVFDRLKADVSNPNPLRSQMREVFKYLNEINLAISKKGDINTTTTLSKNKIDVDFDGETNKKMPVLVKSSFFPSWKNTNDEPVYMASPTFMLTYATTSFSLVFTADKYIYIGYGLSGFGLIIIFVFCYFNWKKVNIKK